MQSLADLVNFIAASGGGPVWAFSLSIVAFFVLVRTKGPWTKKGGYVGLASALVFMGVSLFNADFRLIVTKADNVPIVIMAFLVGFFLWLAMSKAKLNDERTERGEPTFEKSEKDDRIFTWPDLVFSEFICMIILTVVMVVWSIGLMAPLEEPANTSVAPNPSKAPWYFLGLQEMLVYFDPWMAGVVLPGLIIVGLMAIPYIDTNKKGNGYFTFQERKTEITLFLFGYLVLWVQLIVIGTFLRGPNWNIFGPYEYWDPAKVEPLINVDLADFFWISWLKVGHPSFWLLREMPGLLLVGFYLFALPVLLPKVKFTKKYFGRFYDEMGPARYYVGISLVLIMLLLPIKMYLRWAFNFKYFVHIQEFFFNI